MKVFLKSVVDLLLVNIEFCKFVAVSTICRKDLLMSHMRSMATSLLNSVSSGIIVARNLNGSTEKEE